MSFDPLKKGLKESELIKWQDQLFEREKELKLREDACLRLELEVEKWKAVALAYQESLRLVAPALTKNG